MTTRNIWVNFMQILCLFEMSNSNLNETAFIYLTTLVSRINVQANISVQGIGLFGYYIENYFLFDKK